ncbi:MAG: metal-sensitive transcriptional regulator [Firmicutes bacterium]|nr:metal-sensitive transcriptional regulator [Bacillota bacterium]
MIEGHVRGMRRMLAERVTCEDLLQLAAIRSVLTQVQARLLENHIETCVADAVRRGRKALDHLKGALTQVMKMS